MDDNKHLLEIAKTLGELKKGQEIMQKALLGNGNPGLLQRVEDLETSRGRLWGVGGTLAALAGAAEWFFHRK